MSSKANRRGSFAVMITVLLTVLFCLYSPPAHAYIDPGTGSALVYVVTGIVVTIYFALRAFYYRLLELLFRVRFKNQTCTIALHSEDPRYEITFLPLMRALASRGIEFTYFTMYERGERFEPLPSGATHQPIPAGLVGYAYLNHLEAKLLVTTTPQLDVMTFRRSKKVKHYCHIPHALGESRFVRPFAYDFFDSVMCCGPILEQNIRTIEQVRGFPRKQLLRTGIPHYDELVTQRASAGQPGRGRTVLIAPSWGPMSLFQVFGIDFVRAVAERFDVIVRPHPQMKLSQAQLYQQILAMPGVVLDSGPTPSTAMAQADILVSDISGIVYEFALIYERPAMVVDHGVGVDGLEGHLLGDAVPLLQRCADFIVALSPAEMARLPDRIERVLDQPRSDRISAARDAIVYNFGKAGPVAARQIEELLPCI